MTKVLSNITSGYFNCNNIHTLSNSYGKMGLKYDHLKHTFAKYKQEPFLWMLSLREDEPSLNIIRSKLRRNFSSEVCNQWLLPEDVYPLQKSFGKRCTK